MQNLLCKLFSQWFNLFPAKSLEVWELDNAFKEQDFSCCFDLAFYSELQYYFLALVETKL